MGIFRTWLEKIDDYLQDVPKLTREKLTQSISNRTNPFASWFDGKERILIPIEKDITIEPNYHDNDMKIEIMKILSIFGYLVKNEDLSKNIVLEPKKDQFGTPTGKYQPVKVITALQKISNTKFTLEKQNEKIQYKRMVDRIDRLIQFVIKGKTASAQELDTQNVWVIISQNPHDVATMSTCRGWTSCMNLKDGSRRKYVKNVIERGGFVAYAVKMNQTDAQNLANDTTREIPENTSLARVIVKPFVNEKDKSKIIAVPENRVYSTINGQAYKQPLLTTVNKWINSKQTIEHGRYRRTTGYSDSYDKKEYFQKTDKQSLINALAKHNQTSIKAMYQILNKPEADVSDEEIKALHKYFYRFSENSWLTEQEKFILKFKNRPVFNELKFSKRLTRTYLAKDQSEFKQDDLIDEVLDLLEKSRYEEGEDDYLNELKERLKDQIKSGEFTEENSWNLLGRLIYSYSYYKFNIKYEFISILTEYLLKHNFDNLGVYKNDVLEKAIGFYVYSTLNKDSDPEIVQKILDYTKKNDVYNYKHADLLSTLVKKDYLHFNKLTQ